MNLKFWKNVDTRSPSEIAQEAYSMVLPPPDEDPGITRDKEASIFRVLAEKSTPEIVSFFRSFGLPQNWFHISERTLSKSIDALVNPYKTHAWVYVAVSAKARDIASVPLNIFEGPSSAPDEGARRIPEDDPLQQVFRHPNPYMTGEEMQESMSIHLDLKGEFTWWLRGPNSSKYKAGTVPGRIYPIWPGNMRHKLNDTDTEIVGWELTTSKGGVIQLTPDEVLHVRLHNPYDSWRGLAPMDAASQDAATDWKASRFAEALIANGGEPGGILSTDIDLGKDQIDEMRAKWADRHESPDAAGRIAVLTGGLRYQAIGVTQKDMQWSEQRHWSREAILACFGVPELVAGLAKDVNRTTAQAVKRLYWQDVLVPRLQMIQRSLSQKLFKPISKSQRRAANSVLFGLFDLNRVEALKEDFGEKMKWALSLQKLGYGINAINQRLNLDMPKVPWGNEPLMQPNMVPITMLFENPGLFVQQPKEDEPDQDEEQDGKNDKNDKNKGKRTAVVAGTGAAQAAPRTVASISSIPILRRRELVASYRQNQFHAGQFALTRALDTYYERTKQAQLNALAAFRIANGRADAAPQLYASLPDDSPLTREEIEAILLPGARYAQEMALAVREVLPAVSSGALAFLSEELDGFSVVNPNDEWVASYIGKRLASMISVARADRKLIRLAIVNAILKDRAIDLDGIRAEISRVMTNFPTYRSELIAVTEAGQLSNTVRYHAMGLEGVEEHEWITADDEDVRPSLNPEIQKKIGGHGNQANHRVLNGQIRKLGERFANGLLHPGDPDGDIDEIIKCRCLAAAIR